MILSERKALESIDFGGNIMNNNCLCHIFDDNCTWIIILAIIVVLCCCCNH